MNSWQRFRLRHEKQLQFKKRPVTNSEDKKPLSSKGEAALKQPTLQNFDKEKLSQVESKDSSEDSSAELTSEAGISNKMDKMASPNQPHGSSLVQAEQSVDLIKIGRTLNEIHDTVIEIKEICKEGNIKRSNIHESDNNEKYFKLTEATTSNKAKKLFLMNLSYCSALFATIWLSMIVVGGISCNERKYCELTKLPNYLLVAGGVNLGIEILTLILKNFTPYHIFYRVIRFLHLLVLFSTTTWGSILVFGKYTKIVYTQEKLKVDLLFCKEFLFTYAFVIIIIQWLELPILTFFHL